MVFCCPGGLVIVKNRSLWSEMKFYFCRESWYFIFPLDLFLGLAEKKQWYAKKDHVENLSLRPYKKRRF